MFLRFLLLFRHRKISPQADRVYDLVSLQKPSPFCSGAWFFFWIGQNCPSMYFVNQGIDLLADFLGVSITPGNVRLQELQDSLKVRKNCYSNNIRNKRAHVLDNRRGWFTVVEHWRWQSFGH